MFTVWLVDLISLHVELHNPANLVEAMSLARAFEKKILHFFEHTKGRYKITSSTQRASSSTSNVSARSAATTVTLSA